jgi:hypothetical protein
MCSLRAALILCHTSQPTEEEYDDKNKMGETPWKKLKKKGKGVKKTVQYTTVLCKSVTSHDNVS